jgi:hypothetical protein
MMSRNERARKLSSILLVAIVAALGAALPGAGPARGQGIVIGGCNIVQFTQCPNADLSGHNMSNYNLTASNLFGANFRGDTLDGTDLSYAYLQGADFSGATLNGVNFTAAVLAGTDMSGATLSNITWTYAMCPDGTTSEMYGGTCENHLGAAGNHDATSPPGCNIGDTHNCPESTPAPGANCSPIDPRCGSSTPSTVATATPQAGSQPGCTIVDPRCR